MYPFLVSADILISEFSIGGDTGHTNDDFIELYNTEKRAISLSHWKLRKRTQAGVESSIRELGTDDCIAPNGFFLWANSDVKNKYREYADTTSSATLTPNNSVALFDSTGTLKDAVTFGGDHAAPFPSTTLLKNPTASFSHTRDLVTLNWQENTLSTPTKSLSSTACTPSPPDKPIDPQPIPPAIRINEIFPHPSAPGDTGEYVELYSARNNPLNLSGWKLTDATKTGHYLFPVGSKTTIDGYIVVTDTDFSFALNNGSETVSLFNADGTLVDSVSYTKTTPDASLNYTTTGWRLSQTLTPGSQNILSNTLPTTDAHIPKKGYRNTFIDFQADGKDTDSNTLKYVWDFGDGHKSYKETTHHRYLETGTYTITLTTKDGTEETFQSFTIEIKNFTPPKLRLTALFPNPAGKDTAPEAEWIEIENRSKKPVDLLGYSLATGWKKLVNHPIKTSFIIPKKSSRKLTRDFALFTLPNQKGKIELRAPDGKAVHSLKYTYAKSLTDNTTLTKEKGKRLALIIPPLAQTIPRVSRSDSEEILPKPKEDTPSQLILTSHTIEVFKEYLTTKQHEQSTRLLRITTIGTPITFSETFLSTLSLPTPRNTEQLLIASPPPLLTFLTSLTFRINEWLNNLPTLSKTRTFS